MYEFPTYGHTIWLSVSRAYASAGWLCIYTLILAERRQVTYNMQIYVHIIFSYCTYFQFVCCFCPRERNAHFISCLNVYKNEEVAANILRPATGSEHGSVVMYIYNTWMPWTEGLFMAKPLRFNDFSTAYIRALSNVAAVADLARFEIIKKSSQNNIIYVTQSIKTW